MNNNKNNQTLNDISRIFQAFKTSDAALRPHFILCGPSGAGKTYNIQALTKEHDLQYVEINAAQLTKEGTSGNSLSKALAPLGTKQDKPVVCFVEEFDKLFISGNCNTDLAHETTNGVQNEFLKVLESDEATVAGDYGKYNQIPVKKVLFVFAGAFNGEPDITIDRLRDFGIKTEFIGRVGLVYNLQKLSLNELLQLLEESPLLDQYVTLYEGANKQDAIDKISDFITKNYENNTLGARIINTLVHQYFIKRGQLGLEEVKELTFQKKIKF